MQQVPAQPELIDAQELALRWRLPVTWAREQTRNPSSDPIRPLKWGRYRRFEFGSSTLNEWLDRGSSGAGARSVKRAGAA
jgi:hypothetical protein